MESTEPFSDAEAIADDMRLEAANDAAPALSSGFQGEEPSEKLKKFWSKYVVPWPPSQAGSSLGTKRFPQQVGAHGSDEPDASQETHEFLPVFYDSGAQWISRARGVAGPTWFIARCVLQESDTSQVPCKTFKPQRFAGACKC